MKTSLFALNILSYLLGIGATFATYMDSNSVNKRFFIRLNSGSREITSRFVPCSRGVYVCRVKVINSNTGQTVTQATTVYNDAGLSMPLRAANGHDITIAIID